MYDLLRVPNRIVSFQTRPTAILPHSYTNVEVVGVVGYSIAVGIEDITAKYQQMLPYIDGISTDFTKAEYVIVRHTDSNTPEVLALAWIIPESIQTTAVVNKTIQLYNVSSAIDEQLQKMLLTYGFTNFRIVTN